mgnify:CR=1 FL=1
MSDNNDNSDKRANSPIALVVAGIVSLSLGGAIGGGAGNYFGSGTIGEKVERLSEQVGILNTQVQVSEAKRQATDASIAEALKNMKGISALEIRVKALELVVDQWRKDGDRSGGRFDALESEIRSLRADVDRLRERG